MNDSVVIHWLCYVLITSDYEPFVDFFSNISALCQLVCKSPSKENNCKFATIHKAYGKHVLRLFENENHDIHVIFILIWKDQTKGSLFYQTNYCLTHVQRSFAMRFGYLKFEIGIDFWKNWGKTFVYEGGEKVFQSSGNYWKLRKCQGIIL